MSAHVLNVWCDALFQFISKLCDLVSLVDLLLIKWVILTTKCSRDGPESTCGTMDADMPINKVVF